MKKLDDVFDIEPFDRTEIISQSGDVIVPDQGSTKYMSRSWLGSVAISHGQP